MPHSIQEILKEFEGKQLHCCRGACIYPWDTHWEALRAFITQTYTQARASALQEAVEVVEKLEFDPWDNRNGIILIPEKESLDKIISALTALK